MFKAPKTHASHRSVPLPSALTSELLALRSDQEAQKRLLGERYEDHGLVFCQPNGKPLHAHNIARRDFREVLKRAGLPRIRFHDLRHCCATLMLARGVHPKIVAGLLGHSSVTVTLDTYSHAIPALEEEAVRSLEVQLLGGAAGRGLGGGK